MLIDNTTQRFSSSVQPEPDVLVIHTTEGMGWPGYAGGGEAPHATIRATAGSVSVREHIPFTQYAKALMNLPGGVETNRRGVIQIELIGTCDWIHRGDKNWYYWPEADDATLKELALYLRPILVRYAIPFVAPAFLPYPDSYGSKNGQRMSNATWNAFQGICGHQHVPENLHGDPGAFPIAKLIGFLNPVPPVVKPPVKPPVVNPPAVKPPAVPPFPGITRRGSTGTAVRKVQAQFKARGWTITVDGIFGVGTEKVVRAFQAEKHLGVDGIVGTKTWAAMFTAPK